MQLTVVVPFWNGHKTIRRLLNSLPSELPAIIVDDLSDEPLPLTNINRPNTRIVRMQKKGFFSGAVNAGIAACKGDVLILNQDSWLSSNNPLAVIEKRRRKFGVIGHGVTRHRAWPKGYVQGTFMFVRRDAWDKVGPLNEIDYPLWGATAEWQLRACRQGFRALPLENIAGFHHDERRKEERRKYGKSITDLLRRERSGKRRAKLLDTPPLMSVVIPCYNYGRYLDDAVNSLIGGETSLGQMPPQTFQSFEIVIVDDASTDNSWHDAQRISDDWKGIRAIKLPKNRGTPGCLNAGVDAAVGRYIHILSADDMREPWQLERLLRAAQANPHSFSFSSVMTFKDGQRLRELVLPEYNFDKVVSKNLVPAGIVYPKKAWEQVGGYPEIMTDGREDWAFNVGLGRLGWCGVKVEGFGNLYRRERQNRSWRTGNQHKDEEQSKEAAKWRAHFKAQMRSLYPKIYQGVRPMGCCGGGRKGARGKSVKTVQVPAQLPGQKGMVILEFIGDRLGTQTFFGEVSRTRYRFGPSRRRGYVAKEDAPGMLAMRRKGKNQFRQYVEPRPIKMKAEAQLLPEIADESEETAGASTTKQLTEPKQELQPAIDEVVELIALPGVGKSLEQKLESAGYNTIKDLAEAVPGELAEVKGISFNRAMSIIDTAKGAISAP